MNPLDASTLGVNDKIINVNGEIGTVIAVDPARVNCLAVAWEKSGIWLYSRDEQFPGVDLYQRALPSEQVVILPTDVLNTLYTVPDPTNWLIQALLSWRSRRADLHRIAENGITTGEDVRIAWAAVRYLSTVLDRMRGIIFDWSQN
jgi:hypothetical protein